MSCAQAFRSIQRVAMPRRQRGAVVVLVTVGMLAILAMVGLGIDTGHLMSGKSRLQAAVDAAALAGAKVLDQTGDTVGAGAAARALLATNAEQRYRDLQGNAVTVEFSNTLQPFASGSTPAQYVRVSARDYSMWSTFSALLGIDRLRTAASAVAGPSVAVPRACNVAPMIVCGDPNAAQNFGLPVDSVRALKLVSNTSTIGPGNFHLVRLPDENGVTQPGGSSVRDNMAGAASGCPAVGANLQVDTQPGNLAGPVAQGMNTRFGIYSGGGVDAQTYPPDVVTARPTATQRLSLSSSGRISQGSATITTAAQIPGINHAAYLSRLASRQYDNIPRAEGGNGVFQRRELPVAIGNCNGGSGQTSVPVLGFGCFFIIQDVDQGGSASGGAIIGQFLSTCTVGGTPGSTPTSTPGPYIIQLYRDARSNDS